MQWDVFVSHASEDKKAVAEPLAQMLIEKGLRIWFDKFALTLGDSLRRKIDEGLSQSRFGLVVLSNTFFKKEWPQKELDGLVAREDGRDKRILPVWHGISKEEVARYSPMLADRLAVSTSQGLAEVTKAVVRVVENQPVTAIALPKRLPRASAITADAMELIRVAADGDGSIITVEADAGFTVFANGRQFTTLGNPRSEALYREIIRSLESRGYIERMERGGSGFAGVYKVTNAGFQLFE